MGCLTDYEEKTEEEEKEKKGRYTLSNIKIEREDIQETRISNADLSRRIRRIYQL